MTPATFRRLLWAEALIAVLFVAVMVLLPGDDPSRQPLRMAGLVVVFSFLFCSLVVLMTLWGTLFMRLNRENPNPLYLNAIKANVVMRLFVIWDWT